MTAPRNKFLEPLYLKLEELEKVDNTDIFQYEIAHLIEKEHRIDLIVSISSSYDGEWHKKNGGEKFYDEKVLFIREYPKLLQKLKRLLMLTDDFNKNLIVPYNKNPKRLRLFFSPTLDATTRKRKSLPVDALLLLRHTMQQESERVLKDLHA